MIKVLEQAVEKVKKLSKERQEYAAEVLEEIVSSRNGAYPLHSAKVGDPYSSRKVDDIVYGPRRGRTIEDFLKRAGFRSKDKNLSKKVDEIVYGNHR